MRKRRCWSICASATHALTFAVVLALEIVFLGKLQLPISLYYISIWLGLNGLTLIWVRLRLREWSSQSEETTTITERGYSSHPTDEPHGTDDYTSSHATSGSNGAHESIIRYRRPRTAAGTATHLRTQLPREDRVPTHIKVVEVSLGLVFFVQLVFFLVCVEYTYHDWIFQIGTDVRYLRLGAVGNDMTKVSFRVPGNDREVWIQYRKTSDSGNETWIDTERVKLSADQDWVGTMELRNLEPSTTYDYQLQSAGEELISDAQPAFSSMEYKSPYRFKTFPPPDASKPFSFAFGSCIKPRYPYGRTGIPGFDVIKKLEPDFLVLLGDFVYADSPYYLGVDAEHYWFHYRVVMDAAPTRSLMSSTPGFYIYDDHEIINNWDGPETQVPYPAAKAAFRTYLGNANPVFTPETSSQPESERPLYFTYSYGQLATFFVADLRRYRQPDNQTALGSEQKQRLFEWLQDTTHTWKVFATSVPFTTNWRMVDNDTWAGFVEERQEILNFVRDQSVKNLIVISGDRHQVGVTRILTRDPPQPELVPPLPADTRDATFQSSPEAIIEFSASPINQFYFSLIDTYHPSEQDQKIFYDPVGFVKIGLLYVEQDRVRFELHKEGGQTWGCSVEAAA